MKLGAAQRSVIFEDCITTERDGYFGHQDVMLELEGYITSERDGYFACDGYY
ncbi:MAG: hypothetical protein NXI32_03810 [bacterium]|nr:hypothetical protein [bacterium]